MSVKFEKAWSRIDPKLQEKYAKDKEAIGLLFEQVQVLIEQTKKDKQTKQLLLAIFENKDLMGPSYDPYHSQVFKELFAKFPSELMEPLYRGMVPLPMLYEVAKMGRVLSPSEQKDADTALIFEKNRSGIESIIIGLNLSPIKEEALFALFWLYNDKVYKKNRAQGKLFWNPVFSFTKAEYFDRMGVGKTKYRGKTERWGSARKAAWDALLGLVADTFYFDLEKRGHYDEFDTEKAPERLRYIGHIVESILYDPDESDVLAEEDETTSKKARGRNVAIKLGRIFNDCNNDIRTYFINKPKDYFRQLKAAWPKAPDAWTRFMNWLYVTGRQSRGKKGAMSGEIGIEKLTIKLRMDNLIKYRKPGLIYKTIADCFSHAIEDGILLSYESVEAKTMKMKYKFVLNPDRFPIIKSHQESTRPF